ncbi:recombinase family protein [Paenibacillus larvae]|nr:recombinase family protein [Paenibacillus larvae]MDT2255767.1 recombinase family protein [Paenibacillus larvae]MDT2306406.1 recombinase family protein [Paenibacillus larvae]
MGNNKCSKDTSERNLYWVQRLWEVRNQKVYTNLKNIGDRKRKLVKKDQELWQKSEKRTHPEIISQELYKKAQEIRQIRGGGKRGEKEICQRFCKDYLL